MWLQGKPVNGMAGCHCERSRSDPRSNLGIKTKIATPPAGARNDRRAGTSPAPTRQPRRSVPTAIPVFCRGEAELSKTRSQGFCLAPTPRRAARCAAPARRPKSPHVIARRSRSNLVVSKKRLPHPLRGLAMTDGQGRALPLRADPPPVSLRGATEAIWRFSKQGLPRPLRGLAMTNRQGRALPLRAVAIF